MDDQVLTLRSVDERMVDMGSWGWWRDDEDHERRNGRMMMMMMMMTMTMTMTMMVGFIACFFHSQNLHELPISCCICEVLPMYLEDHPNWQLVRSHITFITPLYMGESHASRTYWPGVSHQLLSRMLFQAVGPRRLTILKICIFPVKIPYFLTGRKMLSRKNQYTNIATICYYTLLCVTIR